MEEIWKDIKGYEGYYQVSNTGKVISIKTGKFLSQCDSNGYKIVRLSFSQPPRNISIHRLVAIAFIPNLKDKPIINHKDCVRDNNVVQNLEWSTYKENSMTKNRRDKSTWKKNKNKLKDGIFENLVDELWALNENIKGYEISNYGRVRNIKSGKILKPKIHTGGYINYHLNGKYKYAHRLVIESFVCKIPKGKDINHINGDKQDNFIKNLEITTRSENLKHSYTKNLRKPQALNSKLSKDKIKEILILYNENVLSTGEIGKLYEISDTCVQYIGNGKTWKEFDYLRDKDIISRKKHRFSKSEKGYKEFKENLNKK